MPWLVSPWFSGLQAAQAMESTPGSPQKNAIASFTADLWRSRLQPPSPLTIVSLGLCAAGDVLHSWD